MNQPTIRVSPSDYPKFNFLQRFNFLSEFKTEVDKARARHNLGIPDEYSLTWGNISGNIESQPDLVELVRQTNNNLINNYITQLQSDVQVLKDTVNGGNTSIINTQNRIDDVENSLDSYRDYFEAKIAKLGIDLEQTTALIRILDPTSGSSADVSSLWTTITEIRNTNSVLQSSVANLQTEINNIKNNGHDTRITQLENKVLSIETSLSLLSSTVNTLSSEVSRLSSQISTIALESITPSRSAVTGTTESDLVNIIITATFSNGSTKDATAECTISSSDNSVASWNNGIKLNGVGNATITYTYTINGVTRTAETQVTVTNSEVQIPQQYVGYANNYQQVFQSSNFACDTIAGTWTSNNTPVYGEAPYAFYVITTQNIRSIGDFISNYNINDLIDTNNSQVTDNQGRTYNVYKIAPLFDTNTDIIITIQ